MTSTPIDLQKLSLQRSPQNSTVSKRRRFLFTRYFLPGGLLISFLGLMVASFGQSLIPRQSVTVVPVLATRSEMQREGRSLFQAAGWIEPRPSLVNVAAMTEGIVEQILVVEGQEVQKEEPIARLVDIDAKLAVRQANATRELRKAELESINAEAKAAKLRFENPVHLKAALSEAESLRAKSETELAKLPFLIQSAEALLKYADDNLSGKEASLNAIAGRLIGQARSEQQSALATLEELSQRRPLLEKEIRALRSRVDAISRQLELLIDESRQVEETEARRHAAIANLDQAELVVEHAELRLRRTEILAPMAGKILRVLAQPGTRMMGLESTAGQNSSTIAAMYNPRQLQVRVDVRLEDFPLVVLGQQVLIETASIKQPIRGSVLLPTSSANIQKNTLEVKVAIDDPPDNIRPEMLVTASFISVAQESTDDSATIEQLRLFVPAELVQSMDGSDYVWTVNASSKAIKKLVKRGKAINAELVEIIEGLQPTDKLIASDIGSLTEGMRVVIQGEHRSLGNNQKQKDQ